MSDPEPELPESPEQDEPAPGKGDPSESSAAKDAAEVSAEGPPAAPLYATSPSHAADDVTVGAWLDVNPSPAPESENAFEAEPQQTLGLWERIKRALGLKS